MIGWDGHKMSKSRGNLVLEAAAAAGRRVDPSAVRLGLSAGHYRSDRFWSDQASPRPKRLHGGAAQPRCRPVLMRPMWWRACASIPADDLTLRKPFGRSGWLG